MLDLVHGVGTLRKFNDTLTVCIPDSNREILSLPAAVTSEVIPLATTPPPKPSDFGRSNTRYKNDE